jgi:hypothetical protein
LEKIKRANNPLSKSYSVIAWLRGEITGTYLERDGDNLLMIYVSVNPDI